MSHGSSAYGYTTDMSSRHVRRDKVSNDLRAGGSLWLGSTNKACNNSCRWSPTANKAGSDKAVSKPPADAIDNDKGSDKGKGGPPW